MEKLKKIITSVCMFLYFLPMRVQAVSLKAVQTDTDFMDKFDALMAEYEYVINFVSGFMLLTSSLIFIYHIVMLNKNSDNPQKRKETLGNMLISGVCLAIQGSISLFVMLYYFVFN